MVWNRRRDVVGARFPCSNGDPVGKPVSRAAETLLPRGHRTCPRRLTPCRRAGPTAKGGQFSSGVDTKITKACKGSLPTRLGHRMRLWRMHSPKLTWSGTLAGRTIPAPLSSLIAPSARPCGRYVTAQACSLTSRAPLRVPAKDSGTIRSWLMCGGLCAPLRGGSDLRRRGVNLPGCRRAPPAVRSPTRRWSPPLTVQPRLDSLVRRCPIAGDNASLDLVEHACHGHVGRRWQRRRAALLLRSSSRLLADGFGSSAEAHSPPSSDPDRDQRR
jgi:hypothetical protein